MLCDWHSATLSRYTQQLAQPLQLGNFQLQQRQGLYLELRFQDGRLGRGEIAPLPGFSEETIEQAEQQIIDCLLGHSQHRLYPSVAFGLDCAMAGEPPAANFADSCLLLKGDWQHCQQILEQRPNDLAKLKVARQSPKQDIELIQAIQKHYPKLRLRLDANRSWIWNQAVFITENIDLTRIEYIEEPLNNPQQSAMLAERTGVGIGLDESLQDSNYRYRYFKGLKALVMKPSLLGPWHRCLSLLEQAHADQVACVFSSAYESPLGLSWIKALAQQYTPNQPAGLDTLRAFSKTPPDITIIQHFQHNS